MALPTHTTDESHQNPGKLGVSGLAAVVLPSGNALSWSWHQSSFPKEGTEDKVSNDVNDGKVPKEGTVGTEAGSEREPTSCSSLWCPKIV